MWRHICSSQASQSSASTRLLRPSRSIFLTHLPQPSPTIAPKKYKICISIPYNGSGSRTFSSTRYFNHLSHSPSSPILHRLPPTPRRRRFPSDSSPLLPPAAAAGPTAVAAADVLSAPAASQHSATPPGAVLSAALADAGALTQPRHAHRSARPREIDAPAFQSLAACPRGRRPQSAPASRRDARLRVGRRELAAGSLGRCWRWGWWAEGETGFCERMAGEVIRARLFAAVAVC